MYGVPFFIVALWLFVSDGAQSIQIEHDPLIQHASSFPSTDPYTTAQTQQIPPTAVLNLSATALTAPTLATIRSLDVILNRTRPILLAPGQMQREIEHDYFPERKNFYTQQQSYDRKHIEIGGRRPSLQPQQHEPLAGGSQHYIDYRRVYGIRYDPHKNRRSFAIVEQTSSAESSGGGVVDVLSTTPPVDSDVSLLSHLNDSVGNAADDDVDTLNAIQSPTTDEEDAVVGDTTAPIMPTMLAVAMAENEIEIESPAPAAAAVVPLATNPTTIAVPTTTTPSTTQKPAPASDTHIMSPSRVHSALQLIKQRVTNLLANGLYTDPNNGGQRFLSLFNVIKFANVACSSGRPPLTSLNGTCYNQQECDELGGVAVGECANGFGVCCVFQYGCGGVTRQNISYFKSPNFPAADQSRLVCSLTLELWPNVRQLLVEFLFFELMPPTLGACADDQFVITGQNVNSQVPILCGINSGQHMYVNVESALERRIFLSVLANTATARAFNIRVSQLQDIVAPVGCLQYYTETTGFVRTFNYEDAAEVVERRVPSYFNNLNYAICIRRAADFCTITYYNQIGRSENKFQLLNVDDDGFSLTPPDQAGAEIYNCPDDFIAINGIRLCGEKFNDASVTVDFQVNAPVTDYGDGPLVLPLRTNGQDVGRGFKLYYEQQRCSEE